MKILPNAESPVEQFFMFWAPWLVLNVCKRRANPELGMRGGVSAAMVAVRLVIWGSWRGYDHKPWSNGRPFPPPMSPGDLR